MYVLDDQNFFFFLIKFYNMFQSYIKKKKGQGYMQNNYISTFFAAN